MRGFKYLLSVLVAVLGLSLAARFVYTNNPMNTAATTAVAAEPASTPVTPPAPVDSQRAVDSKTEPASNTPGVQRPAAQQHAPATARPVRRAEPRAGTTPAAVPDTALRPPHDTVAAPPNATPAPVPAPEPAWQATPRQVARDSAFVMVSSGRLHAAIAVLDAWMRHNPSDTAVGLDLARLKARAGDWQGSLAQYSALIDQYRTAPLLFERGQTYLWAGDARRGEADLLASEALQPRAETERQLGDHYRWQGDLARSGHWYRVAQRRAPADTTIGASLALLDRAIDARLLQPGELSGGDLGSGAQATSDNAGFDLYSVRVSQGFRIPVGASTVLTLGGEVRSASQATLGSTESRLDAWGADASIAMRLGSSKLTATAGVLDHGEIDPIVRGAISADGFVGAARFRASLRRAPAYESLWAPRLLVATGTPFTTLASQASVSLPVGSRAEAYAMGEWLDVSDDNSRVAMQLALRHRLAGPLTLLYAGSLMQYARQTPLYYSPARYLSQSGGVELSRYREQGVSLALRVLPGYAWMREPAGTADSASRNVSAFQLTGGLEFGYRRSAWDLLLATGLSSGREGGYRSRNALLFLRRAW